MKNAYLERSLLIRLLFWGLLFLPSTTKALQPADKSQALDKNTIHKAYTEGEFETAISEITAFSKMHPTHSRDDSIFIAKYLGVMYAANPDTREKGKHYMFNLLEIMPSAKIVDMFVSDEIDRIFERVKEEFAIKNQSLGEGAEKVVMKQNSSRTDSASGFIAGNQATPSRSNQRPALWWVGGATLLAATGTVAYLLFAYSSSPKDKVYEIP